MHRRVRSVLFRGKRPIPTSARCFIMARQVGHGPGELSPVEWGNTTATVMAGGCPALAGNRILLFVTAVFPSSSSFWNRSGFAGLVCFVFSRWSCFNLAFFLFAVQSFRQTRFNREPRCFRQIRRRLCFQAAMPIACIQSSQNDSRNLRLIFRRTSQGFLWRAPPAAALTAMHAVRWPAPRIRRSEGCVSRFSCGFDCIDRS